MDAAAVKGFKKYLDTLPAFPGFDAEATCKADVYRWTAATCGVYRLSGCQCTQGLLCGGLP